MKRALISIILNIALVGARFHIFHLNKQLLLRYYCVFFLKTPEGTFKKETINPKQTIFNKSSTCILAQFPAMSNLYLIYFRGQPVVNYNFSQFLSTLTLGFVLTDCAFLPVV